MEQRSLSVLVLSVFCMFIFGTLVLPQVAATFFNTNSQQAALFAAVTAPAISVHPSSQTLPAGSQFAIEVQASGSGTLNYTWYHNGVAITNYSAPIFYVPSVSSADAGTYYVKVSNNHGSVTSNQATITVTSAGGTASTGSGPTITEQLFGSTPTFTGTPVSMSVGQYLYMRVGASGTGVTYKWYKNGSQITGGVTENELWIPSVTSGDAGNYHVVASNASGSVTSNTVAVSISGGTPTVSPSAFSISSPANGTAVTGTFQVTGTAGSSWVNTAGYTTNLSSKVCSDVTPSGGTFSLTCDSTKLPNGTQTITLAAFSVPAGQAGGTSATASLTVNVNNNTAPTPTVTAPSISSQPVNQTITVGGTISLQTVAAGTAPLSYQWYKGTTALSGKTSSSLSITNAQTSDAGSYSVKVTNSAGSVTSNTVTVTVNAPTPTNIAPSISSQPAGQTINVGGTISLSVGANGTAPLLYQWLKNGNALLNQLASALSIPNAQTSDAGSYSVRVSNSAGSVTSNAVNVTVNPVAVSGPVITTQPSNWTIPNDMFGRQMYVGVIATGNNLSYTWYHNGVQIPNYNFNGYYVADAQAADAGTYYVIVRDGNGATTQSNTVTVTVNSSTPTPLPPSVTAPSITTQPSGQTLTAGGTISLSVGATGTSPLSYQWYKGTSALSGKTSSSLSITNAQTGDSGSYSVKVTNSAGTATSNTVTVTVNAATPTVGAPTITVQPSDSIVPDPTYGRQVNIQVTATGNNLTYTWYHNGVQIPNYNWFSIYIANATASDGGTYHVVVSNSAGSVTSRTATVSVDGGSTPNPNPTPTPTPTPTPGGSVAFPLKVSSNSRYLVDQNNVPFFYSADTPWFSPAYATMSELQSYLDNRKARGFNSVQLMLLLESVNAADVNGNKPFPNGNLLDVNSVSEAYMSHVDQVLAKIAENGFYAMIVPNWFGSHEYAYAQHINSNNAKPWAAYLANRYKNYQNIGWIMAGDSNAPGSLATLASDQAKEFKRIAPHQLVTAHSQIMPSTINYGSQTWLDIDFTYDYTWGDGWIYPQNHSEYTKTPTRPIIMSESHYDRMWGPQPYDLTNRKQAFWSILSGGSGHAYGNPGIYGWGRVDGVSLSAGMNDASGAQMKHFVDFFTSRAWYKLVPDIGNTVMTGGKNSGQDYATAARANDGSFVVAYLPSARTAIINMAQLSGSVTARWFDPSNGTYKAISGSPFTNTGSRSFATPGNNAVGHGDWVLVLETGGSTPTPPAATAPSITTQPSGQTLNVGGTISLSVAANGTAPLSYQWYKGTTALSGKTSSSLSITNAQTSDAGSYSVKVTNSAGSVTSNTVTVTVTSTAPTPPPPNPLAPNFVSQPVANTPKDTGANISIIPGNDYLYIFMTVSGTAPITYQWYQNGVAMPGATSDNLWFNPATAEQAGTYYVIATNASGSTKSNTVTVNTSATQVSAPTIVSVSGSQSISIGSPMTLSVSANGTIPLSYQWYKNGAALTGKTTSGFTIASFQSSDAGTYTVKVTNSAGSVTSNNITISAGTATTPPSSGGSGLIGACGSCDHQPGVAAFRNIIGGKEDYVLAWGWGPDVGQAIYSAQYIDEQWPASEYYLHWSMPMIIDDGVSTFQDIINGKFDHVYTAWAQRIQARDPNGLLRMGHEMNGNWYPHSQNGPAGSSAKYAEAWRHIVGVVRKTAPNVKMVYNPGNGKWAGIDWLETYPGDAYVDYISYDIYEDGPWLPSDPAARWATLKYGDGRGLDFLAQFAKEHGKKIAFDEWGTNVDDGYFITRMYEYFVANNVAYHMYWDSNAAFSGKLINQPTNLAVFKALFGRK